MLENDLNFVEIALAIAPGLLLCYVIFRLDKYDEEPILWLIGCFLLGMLLTFPAVNLEIWGTNLHETSPKSIFWTAILAFVMIAFVEEVVKFLGVLLVPFRSPVFNEPLDGIVYSMMISMGFATAENLVYADRFGIETIAVRAFTAVPAHAAFAIFSGYFIGLAKFDLVNRRRFLGLGLLLSVLLHGFYDFFILLDKYEWLSVVGTIGLYGSLIYSVRLIQIHQDGSPFRRKTV
jgi:protease PrsW